MPRASSLSPQEKAAAEAAKRERWMREGSRRTNAVIVALNRLSKCSNKASYAFQTEEVDKAFGAIVEAYNAAKASFSNERTGSVGFTLPGADPSVLAPRPRKEKAASGKKS